MSLFEALQPFIVGVAEQRLEKFANEDMARAEQLAAQNKLESAVTLQRMKSETAIQVARERQKTVAMREQEKQQQANQQALSIASIFHPDDKLAQRNLALGLTASKISMNSALQNPEAFINIIPHLRALGERVRAEGTPSEETIKLMKSLADKGIDVPGALSKTAPPLQTEATPRFAPQRGAVNPFTVGGTSYNPDTGAPMTQQLNINQKELQSALSDFVAGPEGILKTVGADRAPTKQQTELANTLNREFNLNYMEDAQFYRDPYSPTVNVNQMQQNYRDITNGFFNINSVISNGRSSRKELNDFERGKASLVSALNRKPPELREKYYNLINDMIFGSNGQVTSYLKLKENKRENETEKDVLIRWANSKDSGQRQYFNRVRELERELRNARQSTIDQ